MTFVETSRCYNNGWGEDDIARKPGFWLKTREETLCRLLTGYVNGYLKKTTDPVLFETAEKRSRGRRNSNPIYVSDNPENRFAGIDVPDCIIIPGREDGTIQNPIRLEDLDPQAAEVFGLLCKCRALISDFNGGTQADRKNIFTMIFEDEQEQFDELCREVFA